MKILILLLYCCLSAVLCSADIDEDFLQKCSAYGALMEATEAYKQGEYDASARLCQQAIELDPQLGRAYFRLGNAYFDQNKLDLAKEAYLKATALEPEFFFNQFNLACLSATTGEADVALAYLKDALERGYNRFDYIFEDNDLASLRDSPKLKSLVDAYRNQDRKTPYTSYILLRQESEQVAVLQALLHEPGDSWQSIADSAMLDSSHNVRAYAIVLYLNPEYGNPVKVFTRSLFDSYEGMRDLATTLLTALPKQAPAYMNLILDTQGYALQKEYARQVLAKVSEWHARPSATE